jgi:cytochrome P450
MNARQVRDEVMTMFMAGHETTSIAVTWALYLLSVHPEVGRAVREEVRHAVGDRMPTGADLPHLNLTRMVVDEAMRLYPPAWGIDRRVAEPDVLGGYNIEAGATVAICIYAMHHHPKYWTDPEVFDPYRFSPERSAGRPTYAYLPFGGGPRRCVGLKIAQMQTQLMLASIVQQFELELEPGPPVTPRPVLNLPPARSVLMRARPAAPIGEPSAVSDASNKYQRLM